MGRTPLISAIMEESSIDAIKRLVKEDIVDVNSRANDGEMLLFGLLQLASSKAIFSTKPTDVFQENEFLDTDSAIAIASITNGTVKNIATHTSTENDNRNNRRLSFFFNGTTIV